MYAMLFFDVLGACSLQTREVNIQYKIIVCFMASELTSSQMFMGKTLSHARAGPDHGINVAVLEHMFPSGLSMCFRHICGLQYPSVALRSPWVFGYSVDLFRSHVYVLGDGFILFEFGLAACNLIPDLALSDLDSHY